MPSPKTPEGFYWVRVAEYDAAPFIAHRFAGTWFAPGESLGLDGRGVEILSARLPMPAFDLEGRPIVPPKPLPLPTRPQVPRSRRTQTP